MGFSARIPTHPRRAFERPARPGDVPLAVAALAFSLVERRVDDRFDAGSIRVAVEAFDENRRLAGLHVIPEPLLLGSHACRRQ
jgi:hypothetical protein